MLATHLTPLDSSARSPQPGSLSHESSAKIAQPGVRSQASPARSPQQDSSGRIPQPGVSKPGILSQDSSARSPQPGFLSQESSAKRIPQPGVSSQICLGSALESFHLLGFVGVEFSRPSAPFFVLHISRRRRCQQRQRLTNSQFPICDRASRCCCNSLRSFRPA